VRERGHWGDPDVDGRIILRCIFSKIQKELALTPATNATTPNPFTIIPLQSTRKENSWETEEALARAAVTVETERAKWPNH
jgi:hypothetical protein